MLMPFLVAGGAAVVLAGAGGLMTEVGAWYRALRKPSLQPPDWLFGPAWTLILGAAAASAALAWEAAPDASTRTLVVVLYSLNALCHLLWSPLFFKLKRPDWALIEVVPLWLSVLAPLVAVAPFSPGAAWLLAPYLAWVSFAAWLNWRIVVLNRPFSPR